MLSTRERVGFVGNASALLSAGQLGGDDYVRVLEAFADDPNRRSSAAFVSGLGTMRETFFVDSREAELAPFVRRILAPSLARFGAVRRNGETATVTALRPRLLDALGDAGGDEAVLSEMERVASAYVADPLRSTLACGRRRSAVRDPGRRRAVRTLSLPVREGHGARGEKVVPEESRELPRPGPFRQSPRLRLHGTAPPSGGPGDPRTMAAVPAKQGKTSPG
jgi:hypothetical protein